MIIDGSATMAANVEIQKMLYKLKDLVPGIPQDRKLSKLEIMQYVIDYIADLENVLEQNGSEQTNKSSHLGALFNRQLVN